MSDQEFIRTWNDGKSAKAVAAAVGTTRNSASNRASRLRQKGHHLKKFMCGAGAFGRTKKCVYLPTPEEIELKTKEIRAGWVDGVQMSRARNRDERTAVAS